MMPEPKSLTFTHNELDIINELVTDELYSLADHTFDGTSLEDCDKYASFVRLDQQQFKRFEQDMRLKLLKVAKLAAVKSTIDNAIRGK